jgi:hypothetical protein
MQISRADNIGVIAAGVASKKGPPFARRPFLEADAISTRAPTRSASSARIAATSSARSPVSEIATLEAGGSPIHATVWHFQAAASPIELMQLSVFF